MGQKNVQSFALPCHKTLNRQKSSSKTLLKSRMIFHQMNECFEIIW